MKYPFPVPSPNPNPTFDHEELRMTMHTVPPYVYRASGNYVPRHNGLISANVCANYVILTSPHGVGGGGAR